jgi:hypothetical protein
MLELDSNSNPNSKSISISKYSQTQSHLPFSSLRPGSSVCVTDEMLSTHLVLLGLIPRMSPPAYSKPSRAGPFARQHVRTQDHLLTVCDTPSVKK